MHHLILMKMKSISIYANTISVTAILKSCGYNRQLAWQSQYAANWCKMWEIGNYYKI